MNFRIGYGADAHRLVAGRSLVLGGVTIPWNQGLLGHSDADVLTHAVCDALLGAAALGDIGAMFPDTDPAYAGISSLRLLSRVRGRVAEAGFAIGNVDATVFAQAPRLAPFRDAMRQGLADAMGISIGQVSVKATTTEGLGPFGRGEGMAATAVALIFDSIEGTRGVPLQT